MTAPTAPLPGEPESELVAHLVARLHQRLPDERDDAVRAEVQASLARYADVPVRSFLPIIVERDVVAHLSHA